MYIRWWSLKLQGIVSPHDLAISQNGDTVYVAEVPLNRNSVKLHKYDVINNSPDQGLFWEKNKISNYTYVVNHQLKTKREKNNVNFNGIEREQHCILKLLKKIWQFTSHTSIFHSLQALVDFHFTCVFLKKRTVYFWFVLFIKI